MMSIHVPIAPAPWRGPALPAEIADTLSRIDRKNLESIIETAIALLDASDGDTDLEDDDPAGGAVDDVGEAEDWRPEGFVLPKPIYADDQTSGPINERAVERAWHEHLMKPLSCPTPYLRRFVV